MKKLLIDLNITQKVLLFLSLINLCLFPLYKNLWIGQSKTTANWGGDDFSILLGYGPNPYNNFTDEEIFLWIGLTIVLLIGVLLFNKKK